MIYITKMLKDRRDELMEMKRNVDERLSKLKYKGKPEYHVRFDNSKNQLFVNKAKDRSSTKYITEEKTESAKQIATFDYLTKVEKLIDREVAAIDKALAIYVGISPEAYYGTLCKGRQDLMNGNHNPIFLKGLMRMMIPNSIRAKTKESGQSRKY